MIRVIVSILPLLFLVSGNVYSNEYTIGEWYQYHKKFFGGYGFYHLELTEKEGGAFSYKFYDSEPRRISFDANDVQFSDGFVSINLNSHIKVNLAASKNVQLTGAMWFYSEEDGILSTTNYFSLQLAAVYEKDNSNGLALIKAAVENIASASNDS